jgi:hypothetical protein
MLPSNIHPPKQGEKERERERERERDSLQLKRIDQ